jgi:rfaE bifunctional protein kinase chain/domain
MNGMTRSELESLLARFAGLRLGVIGDFALDVYWMVDPSASLPSVETGKPTRPVAEQRYAAGAAGNVAANLVALGARVSVFGVAGRDPWGAELARILRGLGADVAGLVDQERDWATVAYVKPHIGGIEQDRIDFGDFNRLHDETADRLLDRLEAALPALDALVINSQARSGIHSERFRRRLAEILRARPDKVFAVDSRESEAMVAGCVLKINDIEAARVCGLGSAGGGGVSREQALAAAEQLYAERGQPVFVTRGREGMVVRDATGVAEVPAVALDGEVDTTGAGDAALAGIVVTLACGVAPVQAARVGNLAAAVCAGKLRQTGTASPAEILAQLKSAGAQ